MALWQPCAVQLLKCIPSLKHRHVTTVGGEAAASPARLRTGVTPSLSDILKLYYIPTKCLMRTFLAGTTLIKNPGICSGFGVLIAFLPPKA